MEKFHSAGFRAWGGPGLLKVFIAEVLDVYPVLYFGRMCVSEGSWVAETVSIDRMKFYLAFGSF